MSVIKVALEKTINVLIRLIHKLAIELIPEAYSEYWETADMEPFAKLVNSFKALFSYKSS